MNERFYFSVETKRRAGEKRTSSSVTTYSALLHMVQLFIQNNVCTATNLFSRLAAFYRSAMTLAEISVCNPKLREVFFFLFLSFLFVSFVFFLVRRCFSDFLFFKDSYDMRHIFSSMRLPFTIILFHLHFLVTSFFFTLVQTRYALT